MKKLSKEFYLQNTHTVAKALLGKYLVFGETALKITETESYIGETDKACHAYGGRRTKRTEILYAEGGVFNIYLIYGMYCCLNVITERENYASGVLIRGGEAAGNKNIISRNRFGVEYEALNPYQRKNLLNGPGKVCLGLGIDRNQNGISCLSESFYIAEGEKINPEDIKNGKRIGIDYAEEAKDFLWRYYI
ncbi:MAG: DNA-3-methyladenine glycosylase [Clostridiales bacterium]|nr:DNA-3-methyladenine glycosylase [Clostridiales bacterium]